MWPLRQSTASQEIPLGPFLDSTDGNTQETALVIANTDVKLLKAGATSEVSKNSGGATHLAAGRYYAVLDATDTDTAGPVRVSVHVAGALAVWLDCVVYSQAVYDVLLGAAAPSTYAGGDTAGTTSLLSRLTEGRAGNLDSLDAAVSSRLASASYAAPPSAAAVASQVRTELTTELGRIDAAVSSRMATYVQPAGFLAATFPADPADQSLLIAATDAILAAVNATASQASVDDLPTNAELTAALALADDATLAQVALVKVVTDRLGTALEADGAVYRFTTNALEQAPAGGGGGSDPLLNPVPGAYAAGTAGYVLGSIDASAVTVTVVSPVEPETLAVTLYRGDDYDAADGSGRQIDWTSAGWPDLTGGTVTFRTGSFVKALTLVTAGAGLTQRVRLPLTAAETSAIGHGDRRPYQVEAVLQNGHVVTLAAGTLTVNADL